MVGRCGWEFKVLNVEQRGLPKTYLCVMLQYPYVINHPFYYTLYQGWFSNICSVQVFENVYFHNVQPTSNLNK